MTAWTGAGLVPVTHCRSAAEVLALQRIVMQRRASWRRRRHHVVTAAARHDVIRGPIVSEADIYNDQLPRVEMQQPCDQIADIAHFNDYVADLSLVSTKFLAAPIKSIVRTCARHYGVTVAEIMGARRLFTHVRARQAAMYIARRVTKHSLPQIGRRMGGRDHSTVLHAVRKTEALLASGDEETIKHIGDIKEEFARYAPLLEWALLL